MRSIEVGTREKQMGREFPFKDAEINVVESGRFSYLGEGKGK